MIVKQEIPSEDEEEKEIEESSQEGFSKDFVDSTLFMCNFCNNAFPSHEALEGHQEHCSHQLIDNAPINKSINQQKQLQQQQPQLPHQHQQQQPQTQQQQQRLQQQQPQPQQQQNPTNVPFSILPGEHDLTTDESNNTSLIIHECENCKMTFADAEYLVRHQVRCKNHAESSIRCDICNRGFTAKGSLELHIDAVHLKKKEFGCSLCGKLFARKHILKVHLDTHAGKKDFECSVCGKKFLQKSNLNRHQRIHEAKNYGYGCRFCGQAFTQNKHLKNHMVTMHQIEATSEGKSM